MWRGLPIDERNLRISVEGYPNTQQIGFVLADAYSQYGVTGADALIVG